MCFFRKKKTYVLTWAYYSTGNLIYTDIIKARDFAEAWKIHKRDHPIATYLVDLEEL